MLWTLSVILLLAWVLGLVSNYTFNGFLHILLVAALVIACVRLIQGRRIA